eukprot:Clim_evm14s242 gene=Clim_evmTU14s242
MEGLKGAHNIPNLIALAAILHYNVPNGEPIGPFLWQISMRYRSYRGALCSAVRELKAENMKLRVQLVRERTRNSEDGDETPKELVVNQWTLTLAQPLLIAKYIPIALQQKQLAAGDFDLLVNSVEESLQVLRIIVTHTWSVDLGKTQPWQQMSEGFARLMSLLAQRNSVHKIYRPLILHLIQVCILFVSSSTTSESAGGVPLKFSIAIMKSAAMVTEVRNAVLYQLLSCLMAQLRAQSVLHQNAYLLMQGQSKAPPDFREDQRVRAAIEQREAVERAREASVDTALLVQLLDEVHSVTPYVSRDAIETCPKQYQKSSASPTIRNDTCCCGCVLARSLEHKNNCILATMGSMQENYAMICKALFLTYTTCLTHCRAACRIRELRISQPVRRGKKGTR